SALSCASAMGCTPDLGDEVMRQLSFVYLIGTTFPEILKASAELAAARGDDGVGALYGPVHACPLEPGADHHFTAGLDHASRGAEALLVTLRISHAASVVPDVVDTFSRLVGLMGVAMQRFNQGF